MKVHTSAVLVWMLFASACNPRTDQPDPPPQLTGQDPASASTQSAATSIMRPEVAEEAGATDAPSGVEEIRTVVIFEQGAALDDTARAALADLVAEPAFAAGGSVTLSGHSDTSGSDADNLIVSRRRAEAVRDHLISLGAEKDRITVIALGERRAISPNAKSDGSDNPDGRRRNRRVEIVVRPMSPPPAPSPEDNEKIPAARTSVTADPSASGQ